MSDALAKRPDLRQLAASAASYGKKTVCDATRKRWAASWTKFETWCAEYHLQALPADPATVMLYLGALADGHVRADWISVHGDKKTHQVPLKAVTIEHEYGSIVQKHRTMGYDWPSAHPGITAIMTGIRATHGTAKKRAAPL